MIEEYEGIARTAGKLHGWRREKCLEALAGPGGKQLPLSELPARRQLASPRLFPGQDALTKVQAGFQGLYVSTYLVRKKGHTYDRY